MGAWGARVHGCWGAWVKGKSYRTDEPAGLHDHLIMHVVKTLVYAVESLMPLSAEFAQILAELRPHLSLLLFDQRDEKVARPPFPTRLHQYRQYAFPPSPFRSDPHRIIPHPTLKIKRALCPPIRVYPRSLRRAQHKHLRPIDLSNAQSGDG